LQFKSFTFPGNTGGDHEGPGFDPVGHNGILDGAKFLYPVDHHHIRPGPFDPGSHFFQRLGQFHDLRLPGCIL
jgi:hypothetical protein